MRLRGWPLWSSLLLLGVILAAIHAATESGGPRTLPPETAAHAKICMTRHGLCRATTMRVGDPCSCPHPWRGGVPGHVERMDAVMPALPRSGHWTDREPDIPPYDRDTPIGP